jgi:hypothetical protein
MSTFSKGLHLGKSKPYPEQYAEEPVCGAGVRLDPKMYAREKFEILFFSLRVATGEIVQLSVTTEIRLLKAG